jgi:hypothetical protein
LLDGNALGITDAKGSFKAKVSPGRHNITFSKQNFEDFVTAREFAADSTIAINDAVLKPLGRIVFKIKPASVVIACLRKADAQTVECPNNQPCVLRDGMYEVTAHADKFTARTSLVSVHPGDNKPVEFDLEPVATRAAAPSSPIEIFANGADWQVRNSNEWIYSQPGNSFTRANQGTFVFDIARHFRKISFVVNYRNESNRVLYTMDDHFLRRNVRAPGLQVEDAVIPIDAMGGPVYRLKVELLPDRIILRDANGKTLDNYPLVNPTAGKFGFVGHVTLTFVPQ